MEGVSVHVLKDEDTFYASLRYSFRGRWILAVDHGYSPLYKIPLYVADQILSREISMKEVFERFVSTQVVENWQITAVN